jgi:hypothetical protein
MPDESLAVASHAELQVRQIWEEGQIEVEAVSQIEVERPEVDQRLDSRESRNPPPRDGQALQVPKGDRLASNLLPFAVISLAASEKAL